MKKLSALTRRAAMIAAAVLCVTVAVMSVGGILLQRRCAWNSRRERLLRATEFAAEYTAGNAAAWDGYINKDWIIKRSI